MSLTKVCKQIDSKTKYKITGQVRTYEHESAINIPMLIQYLIMAYYWINEKFTVYGNNLALDENANCILYRGNDEDDGTFNTVYGNDVIDFNDKSITKYK